MGISERRRHRKAVCLGQLQRYRNADKALNILSNIKHEPCLKKRRPKKVFMKKMKLRILDKTINRAELRRKNITLKDMDVVDMGVEMSDYPQTYPVTEDGIDDICEALQKLKIC